jgi:small redox-active disulfide protein 2
VIAWQEVALERRDLMVIKILGTGCPKCKKMEEVARAAAAEAGLEATFEKVTDLTAIMEYPIMATPALVVIDGKVVCSGQVPTEAEVVTWITNALAEADQ